MTQEVTASQPTGKIVLSFKAQETFDLTDPLGNIISTYMEGLTYNVREGNKKLMALAEQWQKDGKVLIGGK